MPFGAREKQKFESQLSPAIHDCTSREESHRRGGDAVKHFGLVDKFALAAVVGRTARSTENMSHDE